MNTADKLLAQIKEDREIRAKATQGEWKRDPYDGPRGQVIAHRNEVIVYQAYHPRTIEKNVVSNYSFIAHAANTWERKNRQLEIAVEAINAARATFDAIYSFKPDDQIRTSAFGGSVELKQALEEMEAVK